MKLKYLILPLTYFCPHSDWGVKDFVVDFSGGTVVIKSCYYENTKFSSDIAKMSGENYSKISFSFVYFKVQKLKAFCNCGVDGQREYLDFFMPTCIH